MLKVIDAKTEEEIGEVFWSGDRDAILSELENGDYIDDADSHSITHGPDDDLYVMQAGKRVLILSPEEDEEEDDDFEDDDEDDDEDFEDDDDE